MSILAQDLDPGPGPGERGIPLLDGVFPARAENPNRRHRLRHASDLGLTTGQRRSKRPGAPVLSSFVFLDTTSFDDRRTIMQTWANYLDTLKGHGQVVDE